MPTDVANTDHLRRFFELSSEFLVVARLDGSIVQVNPATLRASGFEESEILGVSFLEFLHPDDLAAGRDRLRRLAQGEEVGAIVSRYRTRAGAWRWIDWTAVPDAETGVFYGVGRDVTERCVAERESDSFFILSNDLVCVADLECRILRVNPAFERALGYSMNELTSRCLHDLIHPDDRSETEAACQILTRDGSLSFLENRCICKDGSSKWLEWSAVSYPEEAIIYASARDVTERKVQDRVLAEKTRLLERSNEDLEQFAYSASHDLQEPLRMVASYTELLERRYGGQLDADGVQYLKYAREGAIRMHCLLQDLLAYARVGTATEAARDACANDAFDQAVANLGPVEADIARGDLPRVAINPTELLILFQNLLGNAVKFRGRKRPRVRCDSVRDGDAWRFSVTDNGIGLDPAHAERIFSLFQRLHERDRFPGTGLGLAICRKIVTRCGGRIWVESRPGQGAKFCFTLPGAGAG